MYMKIKNKYLHTNYILCVSSPQFPATYERLQKIKYICCAKGKIFLWLSQKIVWKSQNICEPKNRKIFADKWCLYARQWHHLSFRPTCDHHASIDANSPHHCQRWEGGFSYIQKDKIRMSFFYLFLEQKQYFRKKQNKGVCVCFGPNLCDFVGTYSTLVVSFHLQRHMGDFVIQVIT